MKRVKRILLVTNALVVIATLLAYIAPQVHPAKSIIPSIMSLGFPIILALNVLFIVLWLAMRSYYALFSLVILVLGWKAIMGFINFSPGSDSTDDVISVATLNLHRMIDLSPDWEPSNDQIESLMSKIGKTDILCLQESGYIKRYLKQIPYPHVVKLDDAPTALLSRYPVIKYGHLDMSPNQSYSGWFDIDVYGTIIRVYSIYLASNRITVTSERLIEDGNIQNKQNWKEAMSVLRRYVAASRVRAEQIEVVRKSIDESPYPVIVCGDFNDVPLSYTATHLTDKLQDSFVERGFGIGATYAGKLPGLRIDYILADENFEILSHDILKLDVSDHYPVMAGVRLVE